MKTNILQALLKGTAAPLVFFAAAAAMSAQEITPEIEARAAGIVSQMTLEEKLDYVGGDNAFYIRAIPRLGIPQVRMSDGPAGVRSEIPATRYPAGVMAASTWNRALVREMGESIGRDARAQRISIMLGPGVNIYRAPMCGRNFEYYGEDPYLAGEMAVSYIRGVQSRGVMAVVKHFAGNNQEWDRSHISTDADERTLQEIYFPAFRKAVQEAHVGAVMNSYNLLNGVHTSEHPWLNIDILRKEWGFKGILMSDWNSTYSTVGAANAGMDLEMPYGNYMSREALLQAISTGTVTEKTIDLKVQHILQSLIALGILDRPSGPDSSAADEEKSAQTALQVAREGIVMLKNTKGTLPLKGRTLITGHNMDAAPAGGGSSHVVPAYAVSLHQGMTEIFGGNVSVLADSLWTVSEADNFYADAMSGKKGFLAEYYNSRDFWSEFETGAPQITRIEPSIHHQWAKGSPDPRINKDNFSAIYKASYRPQHDGWTIFRIAADDGYRLVIDGQEVFADWKGHALSGKSHIMEVKAGQTYEIRIEYYEKTGSASLDFTCLRVDGKMLSKLDADNIVVSVGFDKDTEDEGSDRTFRLPPGHEELIKVLCSSGKKVTVVVNAGGAVDFSRWIDDADAVLMAWYPGQEGGTAVAEVLSGRVNPSGKLPISIERSWSDNPAYRSYYDHRRTVVHHRVQYAEGVFIGYRGYDRSGVKPLFPFGYGLSYTDFEYGGLELAVLSDGRVSVSFDVRNTGKTDGAETAQVYVRDIKSSVPRPEKELKGFEKVFLRKGESKRVEIILDSGAFEFFDMDEGRFRMEAGEFEILAGSSSADADLALRGIVTLD